MRRKIQYYSTDTGKCPVKEFIDALDSNIIKKIFFVFEIIQSFDRVPSKFLNRIDGSDGLWEIRIEYNSNIYRIFCFFDKGSLVVLTNGYQKKTQKIERGQIELANKYKNDYLGRQLK